MTHDDAPPSGFRLPAATHVGRVRLRVADLETSLDYYQRVLGFETVERAGDRASLAAHGADRGLIELREHEGASPVPRGGRLGLYHYAILLPDRAALGRLIGHLAEIGVRPGAADHLVSQAIYLHDPDGLGIEIYVDRPRSAWQHRDGEIVMATEPLDTADLLEAAGGQPWYGIPPGTVIGHVHLHVGDLARAAAFYQDALGLDRTVWSYPGALFLSAGGYHHHLGLNTWATGAAPAGEDDARLLEWDLVLPSVEDVGVALEHMTAAEQAPASVRTTGVVFDPWGTALRLRAAAGTHDEPRNSGES